MSLTDPETAVEPISPSENFGGEMALVLAIGVIEPILNALAILLWPEYRLSAEEQPFAVWVFSGIERMSVIGGAIILVFHRSGKPWSFWGIRRLRWYDLPLGIAVWLLGWFFSDVFSLRWQTTFGKAASTATFRFPVFQIGSPFEQALLIVFSCINGFAEEAVVRGYLIPRFEQRWRSSVAAIAATSALFSAYHVYQGLDAALALAVMGVVYGIAFVWLRRLWPVAIGHGLADYFAFYLNNAPPA